MTISLGGGRLAATDYPGSGLTGITTIAHRAAQTRRPYLGWAGTFGGYTLTGLTSTASSGGTPITPDTLKEGKMLIVYGNITGESRKFLIDPFTWTRKELTTAQASILGYANIPTIGMVEATMNAIPYAVPTAGIDTAALVAAVVTAITPHLAGTDPATIATAVDTALADNFAAIPAAVRAAIIK